MCAALRVLTVALLLVLTGSVADAKKIAVGHVVSEADVADEAGALTLLIHSALVGDDRSLVEMPADLTLSGAVAALTKVGADDGLFLDLGREGAKLRLTVVLVALEGPPVVFVARAGDGDIGTLARGAVEHVTTKLRLIKGKVPDVALGRLRPYATALRLRTSDPTAAARALADATPRTALAVDAVGTLLAGLPAAVTDDALSVIAARAIGDTKHLDTVGARADDIALAARALAALARTDLAAAKLQLAGKPKLTGLVTLVSAILAELAGDQKRLDQLIVSGLTSDQPRAILALASTISTLDKATHAALVAYAEKIVAEAPGVSSAIGLAAAEAGVDKSRALALVSVRELGDAALVRLDALIAAATDPTSLRIRAELALRRADGKEELAVGAYAAAAADAPLAHRYHGWLHAGKGRFADAAVAFASAKAKREQVRALVAANDLKTAVTLIDKPTSPEELALLARIDMLENRLAEAETRLALAERGAPISPLVQTVNIEMGLKQGNAAQVSMGRLLLGQADGPATQTAVISPPKGAKGTNKVVIDLGTASDDTRLVEPMLEALELDELAKKKIMIAELEWSPPATSFRETHSRVLRSAIEQLLLASPYDMQVVAAPKTFTGKTVPLDELRALGADADAVLVYRVEADGSNARITMLLHPTGSTEASQVTRKIAMPGLVTFNVFKLVALLGALLILILVGVLYFTRAMGRIEIQIARNADLDEALCVEITKREARPPIPDMLAFHVATKQAGAITRKRNATLISSGFAMRVPVGSWYVHLYGTYSPGGKLRLVPDICTQLVDVKRGALVEVAFDLVATDAEVTVQVIAEPRRGILVWSDIEPNKLATNDAGEVELKLPMGTRTISIDAHGARLDRELAVPTAKSFTVTINVARELRLMKDVVLDDDAATHNDLELVLAPSGPRTPLPFAAASDPTGGAKTQAASADTVAAAVPRRIRASTPVPGELLLERYRVTAELGRGAMGLVHRAWDVKLEREVAIKEMADELRTIPEALEMFQQEAKALAQLNHTNIVCMYDQITDVDKVYMIMEFVDGRSLESIVAERGMLPWIEAAAIIDQVCAGLAYAHARKVIHRDIKPANIFVAKDKTVKLGDFGLARVMREVTIRRTEIRGTPLYMAPEQVTGVDVDHRVDLYAIGCTMFELLCGRPPFIDGDILYAQVNTPPPAPSSLRADIPPQLDALVLSLIAKHPDDRPANAAVVRTTLRDLA
ncbi:MAG: serine/threonine protein kinase [Deltaproteobacteria bacterium]|nr:serine/threonine protein kinase [Deltaproteobacteria bacterium]MDQ3296456.1 serine/threonine protein kinase [Myxococcota bacterium]